MTKRLLSINALAKVARASWRTTVEHRRSIFLGTLLLTSAGEPAIGQEPRAASVQITVAAPFSLDANVSGDNSKSSDGAVAESGRENFAPIVRRKPSAAKAASPIEESAIKTESRTATETAGRPSKRLSLSDVVKSAVQTDNHRADRDESSVAKQNTTSSNYRGSTVPAPVHNVAPSDSNRPNAATDSSNAELTRRAAEFAKQLGLGYSLEQRPANVTAAPVVSASRPVGRVSPNQIRPESVPAATPASDGTELAPAVLAEVPTQPVAPGIEVKATPIAVRNDESNLNQATSDEPALRTAQRLLDRTQPPSQVEANSVKPNLLGGAVKPTGKVVIVATEPTEQHEWKLPTTFDSQAQPAPIEMSASTVTAASPSDSATGAPAELDLRAVPLGKLEKPSASEAQPVAVPSQTIAERKIEAFPSNRPVAGSWTVKLDGTQRIQLDEQVQSIQLTDRNVCDALQLNAREVLLVGRTAGTTKLAIRFASGAAPQVHDIRVVSASVDQHLADDWLQRLEQLLARKFPACAIRLHQSKQSLVVSGTASDRQEAIRVMAFVRESYLAPVVDQLEVPRGASATGIEN